MYYAGFHLFYHVGEKTFYSNNGINFFLYVISGQKFRSDLIKIFTCCKNEEKECSINDGNETTSTKI